MESFVDYCKNYIEDNINDYEGKFVYGCDLGDTLTECPNIDGTLTYSTAEAIKYLREWWDDCGSYFEYEKDNFGENIHNPFENPEAYMVCMVIEGVRFLLSQSEIVDEHWNDSFELTEEVCNQIIESLNSIDEIEL